MRHPRADGLEASAGQALSLAPGSLAKTLASATTSESVR